MRSFNLDYLSAFGMHPARFVELAAHAGYSGVGLNLGGAANPIGAASRFDLRDDPDLRQEIGRALRDTAIRLSLMEGFAITETSRIADFAAHLEWVAEMGASTICAVSLDRDRNRSSDRFAELAALAGEYDLLTTTEVGAGILRTLDRATAMVCNVGDPRFRLLVDTMHLFRFGASVADFAALDPGMIGYVQLCDVPMPALLADYMDEALHERRIPGDGDLPLRELVRHIADDIPIGLEIPVRSKVIDDAPSEAFLQRALTQAQDLWSSL